MLSYVTLIFIMFPDFYFVFRIVSHIMELSMADDKINLWKYYRYLLYMTTDLSSYLFIVS